MFELVNTLADATEEEKLRVSQFANAYQLYLNHKFEAGFVAFTNLLANSPSDKAILRHRDACKMYMTSPPPADWDGVVRMTEK